MKKRQAYFLAAVFVALLLYFFYIKYIPLVGRFQAIFLPLLIAQLCLTAWRPRRGTLFFVALFPLINSLPYFFGIYENIPHAPTALPLFLFYFLGWLIHQGVAAPQVSVRAPILKPLAWFSLWIVISSVITFLRYANFYPFQTTRIYEWVTNVDGVTAGGAIMSTIFFSLNYLTGFVFIYLLLQTINSRKFLKHLLLTLCLSTIVSLLFGLFQHGIDHGLGNNLRGTAQGLLNGTFKDAISFGAFVAIMVPLFIGTTLFFEGQARALPFIICLLSAYLIFFIGSRSGLAGFAISLVIFALLTLGLSSGRKKTRVFSRKFIVIGSVLAAFIILAAVFASLSPGFRMPRPKTLVRIEPLVKEGVAHFIASPRFRLWKVAAHMIQDYPLTGVGVGGYIIETSNYTRLYHMPAVHSQSAENYLLQVGAEMGFLGILFSLWLFWIIVRQIWRFYRQSPAGERSEFIRIGAMAGIVSYLVNLQFHTFVGSYEIKYAFWLLVALLFIGSPGQKEKTAKSPPGPRPQSKLWLGVIIILCGVVHFWNSAHSLSLESRTRTFGFQQDFGFYQQETDHQGRKFRWTGNHAGRMIQVEKTRLEIPLLATHPDIEKKPVKVKIFAVRDFFKHKILVGEIEIGHPAWTTYTVDLSDSAGQEVILLFEIDRTWNPLRTTGTPDPRNLGVAVGEVRFQKEEMDEKILQREP